MLIGAESADAQSTSPPEHPLYALVSDTVYLQEIGEKVATDQPVTSVGTSNGVVYAVVGGALHTLDDGKLEAVASCPTGVQRVYSLSGTVWFTTSDALFRLDQGVATKEFEATFIDMCLHDGKVHGATEQEVYRYEKGTFMNIRPETGWLSSNTTLIMADGSQVLADRVQIGPIHRIASYSGTLYLLRSGELTLLEGAVLQSQPVDWGMMPSNRARDMKAQGSRLYITTDKGVGVLRGAALTALTGKDDLPSEDTTCLANGFDGDLWIGTTTGAIRKVGDTYHYFGADHWLPGNNVHSIAVDGKKVFIATDKGIGTIHYRPYTLRKKAAYFEKNLKERAAIPGEVPLVEGCVGCQLLGLEVG